MTTQETRARIEQILQGSGHTIKDLEREAKRELALRRKVYTNWVKMGRMKSNDATAYIRAQETIAALLEAMGPEFQSLDIPGRTKSMF